MAVAQSALQSQYETQAQQYKSNAGIQSQHQANTQDVQHQANASGFSKANLDQTRLGQTRLGQAEPSKISTDQTNLGKTTLDQKGAKSPQKEESEGAVQSIESFVKQQFAETDKKIKVGSEEISKKEGHLQTAERTSQEKTLGVTAVKNLVGSAVDGVVTTGKDVAKAIEELPPPPPTYFP